MAVIPQSLVIVMALFLSTCLGLQLGGTTCSNIPFCRCNKEMTFVNCTYSRLTAIPDIPATTLNLDLSFNAIDTIPTQALSMLSKLKIFQISNSQILSVEPLAFDGLHELTLLNLRNNRIQALDSKSFANIPRLKTLYLKHNMIQSIAADAFTGTESISIMELCENDLSEVPSIGPQFRLSKLDLSDNQIVNATFPSTYRNSYSELSLYLSFNKIEILDRLTFSSLAGTTIVTMWLNDNNISSVGPGTFDPQASIEFLDLSSNLLSEVPSVGTKPRLSILQLSMNQIVNAPLPYTYSNSYGKLSVGLVGKKKISKLGLCNNQIVNATFPSTYRNSYSYHSVDLSFNKIETLDRFTFSSLAGTTIVDMWLNHNNISFIGPGTFDLFKSIENLYLGYNSLSLEALENVADSCRRTPVAYLDLKYLFRTQKLLMNGLSAFMNLGTRLGMCASFCSGYAFEEVRNLTLIRLTRNELFLFTGRQFPGKKNVLAIDLAENDLSSVPKYLPTSLESLDLRGNKILILNKYISYLGSLKILLLARNGISFYESGVFNGLGNLRVLDLGQNIVGPILKDVFEHLQNLTHLNLTKTMIIDLPKLSNPLVSLCVLDLSYNGCERVDNPFSESFPSLQILHLQGNNLGKFEFQSDRGGRLFSGLTELKEVFISSNNIRNLPDMILRDQVSLKILNMSRNQIDGWGPNIFKSTRNIEKLDISFNLIPVLTESHLHDLNNLKKLYLKGNPFICNCDFLWFRGWIDRTWIALPDKESYTCHGPDEWRGKPVLQFTKDKINCTMIPTIVGAVSGALFISAFFVILAYRNRWRLRLRLYLLSKRGRHFLRDVRGHTQNPNYGAINDDRRQDYYDAYISRSDRDDDWVLQHLLPDIDDGRYDDFLFGGDFKLYFDPRDKEPGTMAIVKIFENMLRSRKVIVVLTEDYINDGMNIFELDQATTLYHDQELDDIIVIKVGDVPARRIPAHLYTQMRSGRFIEWENDINSIEGFKAKLKDRLRGDRVDLC